MSKKEKQEIIIVRDKKLPVKFTATSTTHNVKIVDAGKKR